MRILMVSPHPVYSARGTPISVFNRCQALGALGHEVDLVTYPVGEDRPSPGLRYVRSRVPGVTSVAVGPSWTKGVLNVAVALRSLRQALAGRQGSPRYDVVHTHEEAGLLGPALARMARAPHVYDMGNDWVDVLVNYGLRAGHPLVRLAGTLEAGVVRRSDAVICHFPVVAERARAVGPTPVETVYNMALDPEPDPKLVATIRSRWTSGSSRIVLYTGTLEPYQGLDLLLEAMVAVVARHRSTRLVVAGGRPEQVDELGRKAASLGLSGHVELLGLVPSPLIPALEAAADVLVSPRDRGRNTPLKIFSYLRSGRPIVATDIASHTQVLDGQTSILVPPTAVGLAEGLEHVLGGEALARATAAAASVRATYGVDAYVRGVAAAYTHVGGSTPGPSEVAEATALITGFGENARDDADCGHFVAALTERPLGVAV